MNTPFSNVLWKEYRTLRWLWLGCLLGTALLGSLLWLMQSSAADRIQLLPLLWSLALWFPVIYLLACTAAAFAGEREERTDVWLHQLAVPAGTTIAAKLLWPLVSAAAMQMLLLAGTHLARQCERGAWVFSEPMPGDDLLRELPGVASFALFEVLACGLFWSLITSRAVSAVAGGALCIIAVNVLSKLSQDSAPALDRALMPWGWLRTLVVAGILVADVWLARLWIVGRPGNWSLRLPAPFGWSAIWPRTGRAGSRVTREPAAPWQRAWQRLAWQEAQTIRGFVLFSGIVAAGVTWFLVSRPGPESAGQILGYFRFGLIGVLPFLAGLLAWRGEQTDRRFRFFTHRGVTPAMIWLSRLVIWFGALLLALGVAMLIVAVGAMLVSLRNPGQRLLADAAIVLANDPWVIGSAMSPWTMQVALALLCFLSTFVVGLYLQRGVFVVCIALLLNLAIGFLLGVGYRWGVPDWLVFGPVVAWLLVCGARQTSRWMLEQTGWKTRGAIACEWLVPPLVLSAVWLAWWVYSVPLPNVPQDIRTFSAVRQPAVALRLPVTAPAWREVVRTLQEMQVAAPTSKVEPGSPPDFLQSSVVNDWARLEQPVARLRDSLMKLHGSPEEVSSSDVPDSLPIRLRVIHSLMTLADREFAAGRSLNSAESIRAAIRITGLWAGNQSSRNLFVPIVHQQLHERLLLWAERVAPDPEFITVWDSDILRRPELLANSAAPPFLLRETLELVERSDLNFWISDGSLWIREFNDGLQLKNERPGWQRNLVLIKSIRDQRLAACGLSNRLRYLSWYPPAHRGFGPILPVRDRRAYLPEWEYRDRGTDGIARDYPVGLDPETIAAMWDAETRIRCTFACMAITAYRHSYRRLPASLDEAMRLTAPRSLLQDPWGPGLLRWEPSLGWKNTPFVWSVGPEHLSLIWNGDDLSFRQNAIESPNWSTVRPIHTANVRYAFPISANP